MRSTLCGVSQLRRDERLDFKLIEDRVQRGLEPDDWKPLIAVGKGVKEIRIWDEAGTFRVVYVAKLEDAVYVLHCFQKKTQRTSKADIELAADRYKSLLRSKK